MNGAVNCSLLAVTGPTASGKTRRAVALSREFDGEIISADSRQVYCGMDLGTGKDLEEYADVPYHLIDIVPAGTKYNLYRFLQDYADARARIAAHGKLPVICGGTGMYLEAALNGLRLPQVPENVELRQSLEGKSLEELTSILSSMKTLHNFTDVDTCKRAIRAIEIQKYYEDNPELAAAVTPSPEPAAVIIGIDIDRETRRNRISARLRQRLSDGMIHEVESLLASGIPADDLIYYGLEYKFLTLFIIGRLSREEMESKLEIAIHQFAKRQMTWFRGMEHRGFKINWLPWDMPTDEFVENVRSIINQSGL